MPNEGKAGVIVIPGPEEEEEPISRHNSTDADDDGDEYDEFDEVADGFDAETRLRASSCTVVGVNPMLVDVPVELIKS